MWYIEEHRDIEKKQPLSVGLQQRRYIAVIPCLI